MDLLTIGQLAGRTALRPSALRYYEEQGLLAPAGRSPAGYRLYAPEAERTVRFIQRAQRLGFTLADIRILLNGLQHGTLDDQAILEVAEARYVAIERQVTQHLVQQHELALFLHDLYQTSSASPETLPGALQTRLLDRICANPLQRPATATFEWLLERTGCVLASGEGQRLLNDLRGQHVHIWQVDGGYDILVVSDDPQVGRALEALARMEAGCHIHAPAHQAPELLHNTEGYLLSARGANAFIFARLFLSIENGQAHSTEP